MHDADDVLVDGEVLETAYLRVPDEYTVADDVCSKPSAARTNSPSSGDVDGAEAVGDSVYRLKSGMPLRFLTTTTST